MVGFWVLLSLFLVSVRGSSWTRTLRRRACVFVVTAATTGSFIGTTHVGMTILGVTHVIAAEGGKGKDYERLRSARKELASLNEDFMEVVKTKGGDGVRSRLGTVYKPPACELSLCSFPSFLEKFIQSNPDIDLEAIEEPARLLSEAYTQSDFYAYSSNFAEFGAGGGLYGSSPNSDLYLDKSREQVTRTLKLLDEVLGILDK